MSIIKGRNKTRVKKVPGSSLFVFFSPKEAYLPKRMFSRRDPRMRWGLSSIERGCLVMAKNMPTCHTSADKYPRKNMALTCFNSFMVKQLLKILTYHGEKGKVKRKLRSPLVGAGPLILKKENITNVSGVPVRKCKTILVSKKLELFKSNEWWATIGIDL